jgi:adhesin transport system membrane fusion protein
MNQRNQAEGKPQSTAGTSLPPVGRVTHMFVLLCSFLCIGFGLWTWYGTLDIVSVAQGSVVPQTRVKSVQHLEGGIVNEILVAEGDRVKAGQILMILEETASDANVEELHVKLLSLSADIARLEALAAWKAKPSFPEDLLRQDPDLAERAHVLFNKTRSRHISEQATQKQLIHQREADIRGITARIANSRKSLSLLRKQIAISKELLKDNLTTEYRHLDFLREASELESRIDSDNSALEKARSALSEAREELARKQHLFMEKTEEQLKQSRQEYDELFQRHKKYADNLKRTTIRSPVAGTVKTLYVVSEQGVVKPGMTIMDIVPASDRLIVEAQLPVGDIGYVGKGQAAILQLSSRDAMRFGKIDGTVIHVSPDSITGAQGAAYYTVRIETATRFFERDDRQYPLYPGLQVVAFIHTGERTIFEYLMEPFLNTLGHSLQER